MRKVLFKKPAEKDYFKFKKKDPKIAKKIGELINSIRETPTEGLGKPELLRGDLKGFWSRRINDTHRLVYSFDQESITVISCRYHYNDK